MVESYSFEQVVQVHCSVGGENSGGGFRAGGDASGEIHSHEREEDATPTAF